MTDMQYGIAKKKKEVIRNDARLFRKNTNRRGWNIKTKEKINIFVGSNIISLKKIKRVCGMP